MILDEGKRRGSRKTDGSVRWCEVKTPAAAYGSTIFTRGEVRSLTSVTLGTKLDEKSQRTKAGTGGTEQFVLHNFPPSWAGPTARV